MGDDAKMCAETHERALMEPLRDDGALRVEDLVALGHDARDLAERLAQIVQRDAEDEAHPEPLASRDLAALAADQITLRRSREKLLPQLPCADPAWDILLDLFIAHQEQRQVFVTSACLAAPVAMTTALRWLTRLEEFGLVIRAADPEDRRRIYVGLTGPAVEAIARWLSGAGQRKRDRRAPSAVPDMSADLFAGHE